MVRRHAERVASTMDETSRGRVLSAPDGTVSWASAGRPAERPARLRDPAVIARRRDALGTGVGAGCEFHRGARDALSWLLVGGRGPLTGQLVEAPVSARAIVRELAAAEAVLYGQPDDRPPQGGVPGFSGYAAGLEHALMWAEMVTPEPPGSATGTDLVSGADESRSPRPATPTDP